MEPRANVPRFLHERDYTSESTDRERILDHFGVPRFVANRTCTEINGFFGHQVSYKYGDEGEEQNAQATVSSCCKRSVCHG